MAISQPRRPAQTQLSPGHEGQQKSVYDAVKFLDMGNMKQKSSVKICLFKLAVSGQVNPETFDQKIRNK